MTVKIVPQARAGIVERFGKYRATLSAGLNIVVPFVDKMRYLIDLREQVVSFPPQPVITEDNLTVSIDTVIYFQVTDPVAATYEIADYIQAIEQLTMTTLRNIVGGMTLEHSLTSRDQINSHLRGELDGATGKWGIRVNRVELKGIDPPASIIDAMEKQMRAERDKRALILTAEGERQSAILTAEGEKQSAILTAEGERQATILTAQADRQAAILRAQGEAQAIQLVFQAIHDGNAGPEAAVVPVPADAAEDRRQPECEHVDHPGGADQGARHARRRHWHDPGRRRRQQDARRPGCTCEPMKASTTPTRRQPSIRRCKPPSRLRRQRPGRAWLATNRLPSREPDFDGASLTSIGKRRSAAHVP